MASGLNASIPPALAQMHAEHLARRRRMSAQPVMLPAPAVGRRQIAPAHPPPPAPPPPPQSRLERASAYVSELRRVDKEFSDELLALSGISPFEAGKVTVRHILRAVAGYYAVTHAEICSASRMKHCIRPRHVAMYLSRRMSGNSLPEIGRRIGHRDHTTVFYAISSVLKLDHYGAGGIAAELDEIATALGVTRPAVCEMADAR